MAFHTSRPVVADDFLDREHELGRLRAGLDRLAAGSPEWIAVLGRRKVGKTSLLLELIRRTSDPKVRFVLFDAMEAAPLTSDVFRAYALRVLDAVYGDTAGLSFEAEHAVGADRFRDVLVRTIVDRLPPEVRPTVLALADRPVDAAAAREILQLPERLAAAEGVHVLAAWDEFQELARWSPARAGFDVLALMRTVWQRHSRVGYVISGSEPTVLRELVSSRQSPFFQHFRILELGDLPRADGVGLLVQGGVPDALAQRAVDVLGAQPFYLQLLGEELLSVGPPLDESALKEALQLTLFRRTGRLALYFEREHTMLVGQSASLAAVLDALAEAGPEGARLAALARRVGAATGATVRSIERLGDAVERGDDGHYRLADPVFGLWLRWRRPAGSVVPMALVGDDAERATAAALARLGFELVYQSRASRGAFDLLAIRAATQLGVQVKRRALPLTFSKEEWSRMEAESTRLGWRPVVAAVDDREAVTFLDPSKARRGRTIRLGSDATIENLPAWTDTAT
jgi:AAA+ ATPase superfamily predicted ATPase/Holliday junction resolvase